MCEHADGGDRCPCDVRGNGCLPVLSNTAATAKPCESSLDYLETREDLEAFGLIRPFDNFDRPLPRR